MAGAMVLYIPVDVFVVHEDDDWTNETLIPLLESNKISYRSLENDGIPGKSTLENFNSFLRNCRKVLFIISKEFCTAPCRQLMVNVAFDTHLSQNIISFITNGEITRTNGLSNLKYTRIYRLQCEESLKDVLADLKTVIPQYCERIAGNTLLDHLFLQGLCLQHFRGELFGLLIVAESQCFKIDLDEFSKHLDIHRLFKTSEACGQCSTLCTLYTKVCVAINDKIPTGDDLRQINSEFGKLIQHVCDASGIQTNWTLVCTVNGPFLPEQQLLSTKLYVTAFLSLTDGATRRIKEPFEPEYIDLDKRIETFRNGWPEDVAPDATSMAKAGFYFLSKPDRAKCYYCGYGQDAWDKEVDPLMVHAKIIPSCPHIQDFLPTDKFLKEQPKEAKFINKKYKTFQSRLASFDSFETSRQSENVFLQLKTVDGYTDESKPIKEILANAGFFCKGVDAIVQCFACGLKLIFTDSEIDPWVIHADLSSNCIYLKDVKGKEFIQTVVQSKRRGGMATTVNFLIKKLDSDHRSDVKDMFHFDLF